MGRAGAGGDGGEEGGSSMSSRWMRGRDRGEEKAGREELVGA